MKYNIAFFILLLSQLCNAQDVHLSQFFFNDLNLNPAYTGNYDGDLRFTGNYRNQWAQIGDGPLVTIMAAVQKKIPINAKTLDVGLLLVRDQFSGFATNLHKIQASVAYEISSKSGHNFRFGVQGGILQRQADFSRFTFANQWILPEGRFDRRIPLGEDFVENALSPDINAGVSWNKQLPKMKPEIGFAVNHINQPKDGFLNDPEKLALRYVANISWDLYVSPSFHIEPKGFITTTTNTNDIILGSNFRYIFPKSYPLSVYAGAFNRGNYGEDNDAIIGTVGGRYKRWEAGISYDYNTSTLSQSFAQKSSYELAIRYTTPSNTSEYLSVPCERF